MVAAVFWVIFDGSIATLALLSLAAVVVVVLRARTAPPNEARRVALFGIGFLICMGFEGAHRAVEAFSPGDSLSNYRWSPVQAAIQLIWFPGLALLWYSVLAVRVPHLREALRACCTRLLMRRRLLTLLAMAPAVASGWLVTSRPARPVGVVLADPLVQSLAAVAGILLLVVLGRERILMRLDAWFYPEVADQRHALAYAASVMARAQQVAQVTRTVNRTIRHGCGAPAELLVGTATSPQTLDFGVPDANLMPLSRTSAIIHLLETVGSSLRVHPHDKTSIFVLLPPHDAAWVVEADADAIVPLPGRGEELVGVLVVGRRFDGRILRSVDVPFLEAMAAAAGLAVARLRLEHAPRSRPIEGPAAEECPACRCVIEEGGSPGCDCGVAYVKTEVPKLLDSKFRLTRRLGGGGMGAVYLARDLRLDRDVAVKTLTGSSVQRLTRLKPEAWAMATVTHPAIAQIYGIEFWRGRAFLVVEFLAGGTLEDRLRRGPVQAQEAISMTCLLADALAALHEAGYRHGDVKPSNVGFTSGGSPKLLDFGLARETNDAVTRGGTLRYLSPEVLSGRSAEEADDVWSLCVLLHEMVSGAHPFMGDGMDDIASRIRRQRLAPAVRGAPGEDSRSEVIGFAVSLLTAARAVRPSTARGFADALGRFRDLV